MPASGHGSVPTAWIELGGEQVLDGGQSARACPKPQTLRLAPVFGVCGIWTRPRRLRVFHTSSRLRLAPSPPGKPGIFHSFISCPYFSSELMRGKVWCDFSSVPLASRLTLPWSIIGISCMELFDLWAVVTFLLSSQLNDFQRTGTPFKARGIKPTGLFLRDILSWDSWVQPLLGNFIHQGKLDGLGEGQLGGGGD